MSTIIALGRRKTSVARIQVKSGKGSMTINGKELKDYFPTQEVQNIIQRPLKLTDSLESFDINVNLKGGGVTGQAEALRLAISRALCESNEDARLVLKPEGFLTRDPRMVERKKFGRRKARKRFQFSKR